MRSVFCYTQKKDQWKNIILLLLQGKTVKFLWGKQTFPHSESKSGWVCNENLNQKLKK